MIEPVIQIDDYLYGYKSIPNVVSNTEHGINKRNVDRSLKGSLKDKGGLSEEWQETLDDYKAAREQLIIVGKNITADVKKKNAEYGGGLMTLKQNYQGGKDQYQWRSLKTLAEYSNGAIERSTHILPFDTDGPHYEIIDKCMREYGGELRHFYIAANEVCKELMIRKRIISSTIRTLEYHKEKWSNMPVITPKAQKFINALNKVHMGPLSSI